MQRSRPARVRRVRHGYAPDTGVGPAFWVGGRHHVSETVALTFRLGYPDLLTLGVSFMP